MEQMTPVLVVTPHPDDAEGGAGGTIARWTKQGRKVVLVVCTNGDKGTSDRNVKPEDLARLRAEEQRQAAEVLVLLRWCSCASQTRAWRIALNFVRSSSGKFVSIGPRPWSR